MFNFTTLTIYNEINSKNLIVGELGQVPQLRIGNTRFNKEDIIDIQVKKPTPESLAEVSFDFEDVISLVTTGSLESNDNAEPGAEAPTPIDVQEGTYRFVIYVSLSMNSQDAFYSNAFVYKGKPLFIEFPVKVSDTAANIAARVVAIAKKYQLMVSQEKVLDVTAEGGVVTFKGINGYQLITKIILQKYDPEANTVDCCTTSGDFKDVMYGVPVIYTLSNGVASIGDSPKKFGEGGVAEELADNEVPIAPGLEAFCDYNWLIHNLRLPTAANTNFWSFTTLQGEMPVVGGNYSQIIIRMCKDRDGIAGGVVGQRATSVTTHVLYVLGDYNTSATPAYQVYGALTTLMGADAGTKILTTADTALVNPYKLS